MSSQSFDHLSNMATELPTSNGIAGNGDSSNQQSVKEGLARMLKGGVIMDVVNAEQVL
jgi:pyridoxal 5'-phosphate synthase pdxS subunit